MADVRKEDLFASSTMSFGEHLEALRFALIKAVGGLVVGIIIGFFLGDYVVAIIKSPLEKGLENYYRSGASIEYDRFFNEETAAGRTPPYTIAQAEHLIRDQRMTFTLYRVHPSVLRSEIGAVASGQPAAAAKPSSNDSPAALALSPPGKPQEVAEAVVPVLVWLPMENDNRISIRGFSAQEAFMIWVKGSFVAGIILASPWIFYQLWDFVAAGLYPNEKRYVHLYLPISIGLFLAGALLCFYFAFGFVLDYLFKFNRSLGIAPEPRINEWLGFALFLPIGFGLSFQLPLVMLFLNRVGLLSVETYWKKWKISVLVVFILSMLLTPGDPYSMLAMAVPLTALYFMGILLCQWSRPKKNLLEQ